MNLSERLLLSLIFAISSLQVLADSVDSILQINNRFNTADAKITHLDSACQYYIDDLVPDGIPLFETRTDLLRSESDMNREADAIESTFYYYYFIAGAVDTAREFLHYYLDRMDEISDINNQLVVLHYMSKLTYDEQKYEESIEYAQRCIDLAESTGIGLDNLHYHFAYRRKGIALSSTGDFNNGFTALNRSKELLLEYKDSTELPNVMLDLAVLYSQIGLYEEAEQELTSRYNYIPPKKTALAADKINLARNFIIQGNYEKAHQYYLDALAVGNVGLTDDLYKRYIYNGLVETSHYLGSSDSLNMYFEVLDSLFSHDASKNYHSFLLEQSQFLEAMNNNRLREAEQRGNQLMEQARESGDVYDLLLYSRFMADLNEKRGNYREAYQYQKYINQVSDSLTSSNKARALSLYKTQYETEKKQIEINELSAAKALSDSRRQLWSIIALLAVSILIIGSVLYVKLRKARNQIADQNNQLQELNRTRDKFFSIIAHDLRGPVASLQSVDRQMDQYVEEGDLHRIKKVSGLVGKTSRALGRLLENLLNWALTQTGRIPYHPDRIAVDEAIGQAIESMDLQVTGKNVSIESQVQENLELYGDPTAIQTILRNIISNAVKFSEDGDEVLIRAKEENSKVLISVEDHGVGMDGATLKGLFSLDTKSNQGTSGEKGSGLGLILCQELVQQNNGNIKVKSSEGEGTTIQIYLPQAEREATIA